MLLAGCMVLERYLSIKQNGPLPVFGHTARFFYIIHRVVFDATACLFDLHAGMSLTAVSLLSVIQVGSSRQLAAFYPGNSLLAPVTRAFCAAGMGRCVASPALQGQVPVDIPA